MDMTGFGGTVIERLRRMPGEQTLESFTGKAGESDGHR
jgi:hypothetical protein